MNAIQSKQRVDFYINLTSTARFLFASYNSAMNDVIKEFKNEQLGDEDQRDPKNFDWIQAIRDNLFTLIKDDTTTLVTATAVKSRYYDYGISTLTYPSDYDSFIALQTTFEDQINYARPTNYNQIGPLINDSYRYPKNVKPYFYENNTGMTILRGPVGDMDFTLTYLKTPDKFSIGAESDLLYAGNTLILATDYYAMEVTVYDGNTYQMGDLIVGTGSNLTSGMAIPVSVTTDIDLPERVHERMCKLAAVKMLKTIGEFDSSAAIDSEAIKD